MALNHDRGIPGLFLNRRVAAACSLLLHLTALVFLPIAHARVEATAWAQEIHVESETERGCLPEHDDFTCQVCRALDSPSESPVSQSKLTLLPPESTQSLPAESDPLRSGCPTSLGSRAPPIV